MNWRNSLWGKLVNFLCYKKPSYYVVELGSMENQNILITGDNLTNCHLTIDIDTMENSEISNKSEKLIVGRYPTSAHMDFSKNPAL